MSGSEGEPSDQPGERSQEEFRADFEARLVARRQKVAKRKADALAAGKEPFDLDRLFDFYVMRSKPSEESREESTIHWERDYYTMRGQPFMTIEDYAKHLNEIDVYLS